MRHNIFLAKVEKIYYLIHKKLARLTHRLNSSLLILSISIITFQTVAFADQRLKIAEEYRIKGYEEQQKGNFDRAFQYYTKSLSLVPDNAVIFNDMGVLYEQLGIEAKAAEHYLKAIRVNKNYLPPYMNLAYLYQKQGDNVRASEYFQKRIELSRPHDPWAKKAKEELWKIDPERQQKMVAQQTEELNTELVTKARKEFSLQIVRAQGHYQRGLALVKKKDYAKAIEEFDQALLLTPENPKILRALEEAMEAKKKEDIRQHSKQALKMLEEGDSYSAEEEFRKILTILPKESNQEVNN